MTADILKILRSGSDAEKLTLLQSFFKSAQFSHGSEVLGEIERLAEDDDKAIRFWARKVKNSSARPANADSEKVESQKKRESSIPLLFEKLNSAQSHFVAMEILEQIFQARDAETLQGLCVYLKAAIDPMVISFMVKNLGLFFPDEKLIPVIMPYLKNQDERVIANAIEGLEAIKSPKLVVVYAQLLDHQNHRVRANAARALAGVQPEQAFAVILKMLEKRDMPHFVLAACSAVSQLRAHQYLPHLVELLPDPLLFSGALKAIEAIGGEEAITYLEAVVDDFQGDAQQLLRQAITALKNPGSKPKVVNTSSDGRYYKAGKSNNVSEKTIKQSEVPKEPVVTNIQEVNNQLPMAELLPAYLRVYVVFLLVSVAAAVFYYIFPYTLFKILPILGLLIAFFSFFILILAGFAGLYFPNTLGFDSAKKAAMSFWGVACINFFTLAIISNAIGAGSFETRISSGQFTIPELREEAEKRRKNNDHAWEATLPPQMTGLTVKWSGWVDQVQGDLENRHYVVKIDVDSPDITFSAAEISFAVNEEVASRIRLNSEIRFRGRIANASRGFSSWNFDLDNIEITSGLSSGVVPGFKTIDELTAEQIAQQQNLEKQTRIWKEQRAKDAAERMVKEKEIFARLKNTSSLSYDELCALMKPIFYSPSMELMDVLKNITINGRGWIYKVSGFWAPYDCKIDVDSPSASTWHVSFEISESAAKGMDNGVSVSFSGVIETMSPNILSDGCTITMKRASVSKR